jgi:hypothetical protein
MGGYLGAAPALNRQDRCRGGRHVVVTGRWSMKNQASRTDYPSSPGPAILQARAAQQSSSYRQRVGYRGPLLSSVQLSFCTRAHSELEQ